MDLQTFRKQNAAYDDWSDEELAEGLHRKFYADMPRETFDQQVGYSPTSVQSRAVEQAPAAEPDLNFFEGRIGEPRKQLSGGPESIVPDLGLPQSPIPGELPMSAAPETADPAEAFRKKLFETEASELAKHFPERVVGGLLKGVSNLNDHGKQLIKTLLKRSFKDVDWDAAGTMYEEANKQIYGEKAMEDKLRTMGEAMTAGLPGEEYVDPISFKGALSAGPEALGQTGAAFLGGKKLILPLMWLQTAGGKIREINENNILNEPSGWITYLKEKGYSDEVTLLLGNLHGGAEVLGEKTALGFLFNKWGKGWVKELGKFVIAETVQESATEGVQALIDKWSSDPNMTWGDFKQRYQQMLVTLPIVLGGVTGGAKTAQSVQKAWKQGIPRNQKAGRILEELTGSQEINPQVAEDMAVELFKPTQPAEEIEPTGHMQKDKVGPPAAVKPKPAPAEKAPAPEVQQDVEDKAKILKALEAEQAAKPVEVVKEPAKVVKEPVEVVKEPVPEDTDALGDLLAKELDELPATQIQNKDTTPITEDQRKSILNTDRWFDYGLKLGKKTKLYRGSLTGDAFLPNQKAGWSGQGRGLYTTTDKNQAKGYGNIVEMPHDVLPKNPIRFQDMMAYDNWRVHVRTTLGYKRESEFGNQFDGDDVWIKQIDPTIDGVQIGTGAGAFFVKFPEVDTLLAKGVDEQIEPTEPAFKKWFGNSKVVDENGAPKIMHHGGTFDAKNDPVPKLSNSGMFFSASPKHAASYNPYGSDITSVYLSLQEPFDSHTDEHVTADWVEEWINFWRAEDGWVDRVTGEEMSNSDVLDTIGSTTLYDYEADGKGERWNDFLATASEHHDGFYGFDPTDGAVIAVAFEPTQIKSAIGNRGTFDLLNPNIDESPGAKYTIPTGMLKAVSKEIGPIGKKLAPVVKHDSDFASQVAQVAPEELTLLTPQQQAVLNGVMRDLKGLGLPDTATGSVRAYMVPAQRTLGVHKSVQPKHDDGSIVGIKYLETIAEDTTGHTRMSLLQTAAHEIGHSVDTGHTNRGQNKVYASLSSPLFGNPVSSPGPIIQELLTVYNENLMELSRPLEYPMKYLDSIPDFQSLVKKTGGGTNARALINKEAFAQLFSYYYTYGRTPVGAKGMAKHMPTSFQFMEAIHEILSTSKSVAERDAGVREAFRTFAPGRVPRTAQRGQPGKASPEGGQAGPGAGLLQGQADEAIQSSTDAGDGPVTETPAFKKWFGNSKVVDESGTPLVVYHGTNEDIKEFSTEASMEDGIIFFTDSQSVASDFGLYRRTYPGAQVTPVYLKLNNPLIIEGERQEIRKVEEQAEKLFNDIKYGETVRQYARRKGHDGIIFHEVMDNIPSSPNYPRESTVYAVFKPTQIKSAIGNRGTFDLLSPNIDENAIMQPTGFEVADERAVWDKTARIMQDKFQRLYVTQGAIREQGGDVTVGKDAHAAEERMHGKVENDFKVLENEYIEPLADILADRDISIEDLDQYVYARHAPERNRHIATQRDDMPDGGSGMFTADAEAEVARLEAKHGDAIEIAAEAVWRMLDHKRSMMENMSLERGDTIDIWHNTYDYYVPLKGLAEDSINELHPRIGKGLSIKGPESKRAYGRRSRAKDITTQVIADTSETIMRARKNEVGQHFLYLVQANPNPAFWEIYSEDNPDREERQGKMQNVPMHMDPRYFGTKFNGKQYYVKMTDVRLAKAMQNLGVEQQGTYVMVLGSISRFLSSVNTSLNPEFVLSNFSRDIQTAVYNMMAETDLHDAKAGGEKLAFKMVKDTPAAGKSIWRALRDKPPRKDNKFDRYAYDFLKDGGKTGFFDSKDLAGMQRHVNNLIQMNRGGFVGTSKKMRKSTAQFVEDVNGAVENGVRLSAYINAREAMEARGTPSGQARKKAASLSKNLTVNFNRRGEMSTALNAHWMFFNASVQGTAQFARTMLTMKKTENGRRLNVAQKAAIGITAFAYTLGFLNRWLSDDDEDGRSFYDKIPGHVKERNMVLMKGDLGEPGDYWQVPLPYGYNIFHVLGTAVNDTAHGTVPISEGALNITEALLGSFNPLGMSTSENPGYSLFKTVLPTILTPSAEIGLNENFFGAPVWREDRYNDRTPDSSLSFNTTKKHYKAIAKWMNETTGGSMERRGGIDVSPDSLEHWFEFATGGAGKFVDRSVNVAGKLKEGVPLKDREIPFYRKLNAQANEYQPGSDYYDRRSLALTYQDTYSRLKKAGKGGAGQWRQDHAQWFTLISDIKRRDKALRRLRKDRNIIRVDDEITEAAKHKKLERIQKDMNKEYTGFNLLWNRLIEKR